MTPKQKEAQRRAQQMLEAMRAQGKVLYILYTLGMGNGNYHLNQLEFDCTGKKPTEDL